MHVAVSYCANECALLPTLEPALSCDNPTASTFVQPGSVMSGQALEFARPGAYGASLNKVEMIYNVWIDGSCCRCHVARVAGVLIGHEKRVSEVKALQHV